jgi:hypothetical protein
MRRREFIVALGTAVLSLLPLYAQQLEAPMVGFLSSGSADSISRIGSGRACNQPAISLLWLLQCRSIGVA